MGIATRFLKQYAVYWERGAEGPDGMPTTSAPVVLKCRWDDVAQEFVDANASREVSQSMVMVDREVKIGGWLMLWGTIADLAGAPTSTIISGLASQDPNALDEAYPIRQVMNNPTVSARETVRTAVL